VSGMGGSVTAVTACLLWRDKAGGVRAYSGSNMIGAQINNEVIETFQQRNSAS